MPSNGRLATLFLSADRLAEHFGNDERTPSATNFQKGATSFRSENVLQPFDYLERGHELTQALSPRQK
jgi:hypothetical protein